MEPVIKIAPSLLSADFTQLGEDVTNILESGADWLHLDIMDGHFVNNLTFGPPIVKQLREKNPDAFLDCHLMVNNPEKLFNSLFECRVNQITFHVESLLIEDPIDIIQRIKNQNIRVGIAFKPNTHIDLDLIKRYVEHGLDYILIMTVEPGFGGQELIPECLNKVKMLRKQFSNLDIGVDGGVNFDNVKQCAEAGSNVIVSGSCIFKHENWNLAIDNLRNQAKKNLFIKNKLSNGLLSSFENGRVVIAVVIAGAICATLLSDQQTCDTIHRYYQKVSRFIDIQK